MRKSRQNRLQWYKGFVISVEIFPFSKSSKIVKVIQFQIRILMKKRCICCLLWKKKTWIFFYLLHSLGLNLGSSPFPNGELKEKINIRFNFAMKKALKNTKKRSKTRLRCLKITGKNTFNIASEASYVYIWSGQKLIKNAKNGQFGEFFEKLKLAVKQCYQTGHF